MTFARTGRSTRTARRHEDGRLVLEINDDGVGGARPDAGSGLRGLADRVAALDGDLDISSPAGQGTRLRVQLPCR
jgi:signal transduction histidine kinase